ncbi:host-nuclease inhibitor Gam family protein [Lacticaseibacillus sp. 53-4]|uniref:host-nuclease inhibitor Gam family protein n=1 Tax=Lacticaseibacillus sp. 53-4 TaxID=2799575 RepID=UPI001941C6DA|nr:host-nuclease inhibitor Gam family protein [Lacticaseibacillus sp. 53-4]
MMDTSDIKRPGAVLDDQLENAMDEIRQFGAADTKVVTDVGSADWALRKLAELDREDKEDQEEASKHITEWTDWRDHMLESRQSFRDFLTHELTAYATNKRVADPKYKLTVPGGVVSFTHYKPKVAVGDADAALKFVKDNWDEKEQAGVIKVTEKLQLTPFKKALKVAGDKVVDADGQPVEGVMVEPEHESISIKPNSEAVKA